MTWTGNVKLVKDALVEWDMREAKEVETPGMTDEYDMQSLLNADLMSKESAAKYRRTAAKLNYLALGNPLIAFASKEASRSMSSPRQGRSEIEENIEILAKETYNDIPTRVARSPRRIDWVHR